MENLEIFIADTPVGILDKTLSKLWEIEKPIREKMSAIIGYGNQLGGYKEDLFLLKYESLKRPSFPDFSYSRVGNNIDIEALEKIEKILKNKVNNES